MIRVVKDWTCTQKGEARDLAVLAPFRKYVGDRVPKGKQYWTLAGRCADEHGDPVPGCEIDHVLRTGLATARQFHGVELDGRIHRANAEAWPDAHWYHRDFYTAMAEAVRAGTFDPAIVHYDGMLTPPTAAPYVARCMRLLAEWYARRSPSRRGSGCVLFVANLVMYDPYHAQSFGGGDVVRALNAERHFHTALGKGDWTVPGEYLRYTGTGALNNAGVKSEMGSFVAVLGHASHLP